MVGLLSLVQNVSTHLVKFSLKRRKDVAMNIRQMITRSSFCLLVVLGLSLLASPAAGQVFDSGPSDSALFDSVFDLRLDLDIFFRGRVGGDGSTTQINIFEGGSLGVTLFGPAFGSGIYVTNSVEPRPFAANSGSEINVIGGFLGRGFNANSGSEVNISSGSLGAGFSANSGSEVNISGGSTGEFFNARPGSDVQLIGGEFQFNGTAFSGPTVSLGAGDTLSGTLTDGSIFIFSNDTLDSISNVTLTQGELPTLDLSPMIVETADPVSPFGLRAGQTMTLLDGGELGDGFQVVDATLNVEGGEIGSRSEVIGSEVNISGGSVGFDLIALLGSEVNISGGTVANRFEVFQGSVVNVSGGAVGLFFRAHAGSEVNISGGSVAEGFDARSGSVVNVSGGTFGRSLREFNASPGSVVNLFGSSFVLDGVDLNDSLADGQALTIVDRDVTLSGVFADGSPFSFDLTSVATFRTADFFSPDATLTVTLGEPVSTTVLGDVNQDGVVNFDDIGPFINVLISGGFQEEADANQDGVVNFSDIPAFIAALIAS